MSEILEVQPPQPSAMHLQLQRSLAIAYINADLPKRAGCDVDRSIILYDKDGDVAAVLPVDEQLHNETVQRRLVAAGIRSWSVGIHQAPAISDEEWLCRAKHPSGKGIVK